MQRPNQHIHVITGKVHDGKTTLLTGLVERFHQENLKVAGFLCPGSFKNGERSGFTLVNPEDGRQLPLANLEGKKDWFKFRRFYFNPEAFIQGETWIREALPFQPALVVIDEVGPMELQGYGWCNVLNIIEKRHDITQIWVIREQILRQVQEKWNIESDQIFRINPGIGGFLTDKLFHKLMKS